jgi:Tol biopolymer transport system component
VVVCAALATGCGGHGHAPGTIVFASAYSGREAVYAVRPDGTGMTKLPLDLPPYGASVFWTRDGTKAFVLDDTGSRVVAAYLFEPASRTRRPIRLRGFHLTGTNQVGDLSDMPWAPDGKRLLLATDKGDVVLDVETGARHVIDDSSADGPVAWSGDGKNLLFAFNLDVYAAPADGGPARLVVQLARPGVVSAYGPQSSSDGKWIAVVANTESGASALYAVRSNGTGLRLVARGGDSPAWSPVGERLAFADDKGIVVVDFRHGRRRRLAVTGVDDAGNEGPAWSPDGRRILYRGVDLRYGAPPGYHLQLLTVKVDGTDRHPVTHAFTVDSGAYQAVWVEAAVKGIPRPTPRPVSLPVTRTITTSLPIVALGATGSRAALVQGFGNDTGSRHPLGPIVVWDPVRRHMLRIPVPGCGTAYDVVLAAADVGYRCENAGEGYNVHDSLRLVRGGKHGTVELVRTHGEEFTGSFLGGVVADGGTIAFDVAFAGHVVRGDLHIHRTRVWKATGGRVAIVHTFRGVATVMSLDAGRIAVLRGGKTLSVLSPGGGIRTYALGGSRVLGAALDGSRLVVLRSTRLTVLDLETGRRSAGWPVRRAFGPAPEFEDAHGDLAAYVAGAALHVLRLSDGREIVVDTPNAAEPVFARFVPSGLFYSFNEAYAKRPGRVAFVARSALERAIASGREAR